MFNLQGKKIVVTGAAQGNGEAIAKGLVNLGAIVVLADLNQDKLENVKAEIKAVGGEAHAFLLNVADQLDCEKFANQVCNEVGEIDVLVNNAGILRRSNIESDSTFNDLEDTLSVNVKGSYYLVHAFLESLKQTKGNIVNVASIQSFVAATSATTYAISKGAVAQMTKTLAAELSKYDIRVNAIAPGVIETPMTEVTRTNKEMLEGYLSHVPMKRMGQPTELIGPVSFLCSNAASYVTGCILPVDGGYLTV
ncbi:SDR family NAD(P)-dependent oxidoreductase [Acinetobacter indicus]|uniref:SDR family NAD(P)-dependent oxidoreductase n=1 Tax=Acinetobacter indicus TaxID=756892 RepID=UPI000CEC5FA3|nr:glucose 1-dehydrogenase [Acinetobacter indicus]